MPETSHPWIEPLDAVHALAEEEHLVLLYSGLNERHSGRYSLLAWNAERACITSQWSEITHALCADRAWHENAWFGWLGYGMRNDCEVLSRGAPSPITLPDCQLMQFRHLLRFDHAEKSIAYFTQHTPDLRWQKATPTPIAYGMVHSITSPLSKAQYMDIVRQTKQRIDAGDFYQANITRKFTGKFAQNPQPAQMFANLCNISKSAYSAYIRTGNTAILSSSPECFLSIDKDGQMISRPIKGSAPRGLSTAEDEHIRRRLKESLKDHAENRMIVDLVRNDLSRSAYAGTVEVTADAELISYNTVHHLVSTIHGQKRANVSTVDAVRDCFPPGSMTGAPKIAAIEWCNRMETLERGIYSGAIGWFGGDGSCDLSVVIRTLIMEGDRFEFQVGGGIVADSDPEQEWLETLVKARGIAKLLGIDEAMLAAL